MSMLSEKRNDIQAKLEKLINDRKIDIDTKVATYRATLEAEPLNPEIIKLQKVLAAINAVIEYEEAKEEIPEVAIPVIPAKEEAAIIEELPKEEDLHLEEATTEEIPADEPVEEVAVEEIPEAVEVAEETVIPAVEETIPTEVKVEEQHVEAKVIPNIVIDARPGLADIGIPDRR